MQERCLSSQEARSTEAASQMDALRQHLQQLQAQAEAAAAAPQVRLCITIASEVTPPLPQQQQRSEPGSGPEGAAGSGSKSGLDPEGAAGSGPQLLPGAEGTAATAEAGSVDSGAPLPPTLSTVPPVATACPPGGEEGYPEAGGSPSSPPSNRGMWSLGSAASNPSPLRSLPAAIGGLAVARTCGCSTPHYR